MNFSLHTLAVVLIITNIIQASAITAQHLFTRIYPGTGLWVFGYLQFIAGLTFTLANGLLVFSPLLAILANLFYIGGIYTLYTGIKRFLGEEEKIRLFIVGFTLFSMAIIYYSAVNDSFKARVILFSLGWSTVSFLICYTLIMGSVGHIKKSASVLSAILFLQGIFFIIRAAITAIEPPVESFFAPSSMQIIVLLVLLITGNWLTFSLIIMVNQRLNGEINDAMNDALVNRERVEKTNHEMEILLKEVHHRIKNNMNTIIALLSLQSDTVKEASAVNALNDAEGRVRSMMILYDKLYRSESYSKMSAREYLEPLSEEIKNGFPGGRDVTLYRDIDDFTMESQTLFITGIILNELITNIMKYAFNDTKTKVINLTVKKEGSRITLLVEDNGCGFPEGFDIRKTTGFGLQLVVMLTDQLGGSIRTEYAAGSRIIIEFDMAS